ncbi:MAG: TIM barrel protein [Actinomycetota bacterium]|nr:TIM barrel protein [Actinomycetota bacterium]
MSDLISRIAAAPISWGVSEVPGWGYQLEPERVLREMGDLGITATEFGPAGFLPVDPEAKATVLRHHGLRAVGGFLPVLLHDSGHDPLPEVNAFLDGCIASGASVVVLAAHTGAEGYDERPELDGAGWRTLLGNLDRVDVHARRRGVVASLHPHVGTMIEQKAEVEQVLAGSGIGLCVDTGHLLVGGTDPVALTEEHVDRVVHVHLKDVDQSVADRVVSGEVTFGDAISEGLFRPLGSGDVGIAELVQALEGAGYDGWYVLEQDIKLTGEPEGTGPLGDVRASLDFLRRVAV